MRFLIGLFVLICSFSSTSYSQSVSASENVNYGWLKLSLNIEQFYLILDEDYSNYRLMSSGDSLKLNTGKHTFRIVWNNINDFKKDIEIQRDKTFNNQISLHTSPNPNTSYHFLEQELNTVISTDKESVIFIDGEKIGTEYAQLLLDPGDHKLTIKNDEFGNLSKDILIDPRKLNAVSRYNKHPNPPTFFVKLLPGGSYIANKQWIRSGITLTALTFLTGTAIKLNSDYNHFEDDYNRLNLLYKGAQNTTAAIRYRISANSALDKMKTLNKKLTFTTVGIATLYLVTTLDGFRKPKQGFKGTPHFIPTFSLDQNPVDGEPFASFTFKGAF